MMNNLIYICLAFLLSFSIGNSQNIEFSFEVDASDPTEILTMIYAKSVSGDNNLQGFTIGLYYDSSEAEFISYDPSIAENNLNYNVNGNFTVSDQDGISEDMVSSTHDSYLEIQQIDGNFVGATIGEEPIHIANMVFQIDMNGDPDQGGEAFLSNTNINMAMAYIGDGIGMDVVTYGTNPKVLNESSALPVTLTSFNAKKLNNRSAALDWATASEVNSSHFEIERKVEKGRWETLGKVEAAFNSTSKKKYQYDDLDIPLSIRKHKDLYYRLKMVDVDDTYEYSDVRTIRFSDISSDIVLFPNPTNEGFEIETTEEISKVYIYNAIGQLIYNEDYDEDEISLSTFSSGLYKVVLETATGEKISKNLIKVK